MHGKSVILNGVGRAVENHILKINNRYENVKIDCFCIMPNHTHMIICLAAGNALSLTEIVGKWKAGVSRQVREDYDTAFAWQRSFYERIIRNEKELDETRNYVINNVLKWTEDKYFM